jgi:MFS family permease
MTFIYGALNIFFVSLSWILHVYNFTSLQTGLIFIIANLTGLFGCLLTGLLFTSHTYRRNCIAYVYGCIVAIILMFIGLETNQAWLLYIGSGAFGFHIFPYLTTMTDFAS